MKSMTTPERVRRIDLLTKRISHLKHEIQERNNRLEDLRAELIYQFNNLDLEDYQRAFIETGKNQ